jgi:uncharacterized membrane protein YphA (DoxX/SURF4 family)
MIKLTALPLKTRRLVIEIISALLLLLFSYTGIMKIIDHDNFQGVLSQSALIGIWSQELAWLVPIIELVTALLLFIPRTRIKGLTLSLVLMCMFTVYIFYMITFMSHLPCNCGGVIKKMSWEQHLIFNIFFTAFAALGVMLFKSISKN